MTIVMAVRLDDETAAAVDAARGERSRNDWLREAVAVLLAEAARPPAAARKPPRLARPARCPHPVNRRIGSLCAACGKDVLRRDFGPA